MELAPPHCLIPNFLAPQEVERVTAHALAHAGDLAEATLSTPSTQSASTPVYGIRRARIMNDVGALLPLIIPKINALLPRLWPLLHLEPMAFSRIECQLSVHGDGDYFNTHTDNGLPDIAHRRLSYVYYFHREPKRFSGGNLRLYNARVEGGKTTCGALAHDVAPPRNSLMVFPSHIFHEVTPIACPSADLADQRLTVNGWLI